MEKEGTTKEVAKFIVETGIDKIGEETLAKAKDFLIDTIGCALGGSGGSGPKILVEIARN